MWLECEASKDWLKLQVFISWVKTSSTINVVFHQELIWVNSVADALAKKGVESMVFFLEGFNMQYRSVWGTMLLYLLSVFFSFSLFSLFPFNERFFFSDSINKKNMNTDYETVRSQAVLIVLHPGITHQPNNFHQARVAQLAHHFSSYFPMFHSSYFLILAICKFPSC